jgi:hypothetical protein
LKSATGVTRSVAELVVTAADSDVSAAAAAARAGFTMPDVVVDAPLTMLAKPLNPATDLSVAVRNSDTCDSAADVPASIAPAAATYHRRGATSQPTKREQQPPLAICARGGGWGVGGAARGVGAGGRVGGWEKGRG